jgi:LysM repeat protein
VQLEDSIYSYARKADLRREIVEKQVASETNDRIVHTVKKGESLGSIAKKYHVSVASIRKWNNMKKDTITPGKKLVIYRSGGPSSTTTTSSGSKGTSTNKASTTTKTHTVKKGETLSSVSKKYGCTVADLKKWNNLKSNTVKVGQKLKIKK